VNESFRDLAVWGDVNVSPGEQAEAAVTVSESYLGLDINIPIYVWRGREPGPAVFVTAAVHGDEINGAGAIRHLITEQPFTIDAGTLVLVPVVNILGFERHSRYLPDRRDLNRSFPGDSEGSLASRLARTITDSIIGRCDYGIDLHTAAVRRTNFPNIRADMKDERVADLARAFGAEIIVDSRGPRGTLRRSACRIGKPTIILEAGEVWKVEPFYIDYAVRGVRNCLIHLKMVRGRIHAPEYAIVADKTTWVRAMHGGFLSFHVAPGEFVEQGAAIATNTSLTGQEQNVIEAPVDGMVLGMTTIPSVAPGDPVCHLAYMKSGELRQALAAQEALRARSLYRRTLDDLASNLHVSEVEDLPEGAAGAHGTSSSE
jgi:hypothetical protein